MTVFVYLILSLCLIRNRLSRYQAFIPDNKILNFAGALFSLPLESPGDTVVLPIAGSFPFSAVENKLAAVRALNKLS